MHSEQNYFPSHPKGHLSLVNSSTLLRSLRRYQGVLRLLEREERGNSVLAEQICERVEILREELQERGIKVK